MLGRTRRLASPLARLVALALRLSISQLFKPNSNFAKNSTTATLRRFPPSAAICFAKLRFRLANSWLSLPLARLISGCVRGCRLFSCADSSPFRLPRHLSQPRQSSQFLGGVHTFGSSRTSSPARTPRSVFVPRRLAVSVLVWRGRFRWRVAVFPFLRFLSKKPLFYQKNTKNHQKTPKKNKK